MLMNSPQKKDSDESTTSEDQREISSRPHSPKKHVSQLMADIRDRFETALADVRSVGVCRSTLRINTPPSG
jgi:hypothetical protein